MIGPPGRFSPARRNSATACLERGSGRATVTYCLSAEGFAAPGSCRCLSPPRLLQRTNCAQNDATVVKVKFVTLLDCADPTNAIAPMRWSVLGRVDQAEGRRE